MTFIRDASPLPLAGTLRLRDTDHRIIWDAATVVTKAGNKRKKATEASLIVATDCLNKLRLLHLVPHWPGRSSMATGRDLYLLYLTNQHLSFMHPEPTNQRALFIYERYYIYSVFYIRQLAIFCHHSKEAPAEANINTLIKLSYKKKLDLSPLTLQFYFHFDLIWNSNVLFFLNKKVSFSLFFFLKIM